MRTIVIILLTLSVAACSSSKKIAVYQPGCDQLYVDVANGMINGLPATASMQEIKKQFPCFTGDTEEGAAYNCGGGVFFLDYNFYYYSGRDYIEVRYGFPGSMSDNLISLGVSEIVERYGDPVRKDESGDRTYYVYKAGYGSLVIVFQQGKVYKFAMHTAKPGDAYLCK